MEAIMRLNRLVVIGVAVGVILAGTMAARADSSDDAAKLFANGKALLAKADFKAALEAYAAAAKADSKNDEYRQQLALLKRVMTIREKLGEQKDADKWESTARSLRGFYYDNDIYSEALALDRQVHERLKTGESAAMLAETFLELDRNKDAAETLAAVDDGKLTPDGRVLLGIAWARAGEADKAKQIAAKCTPPDDAGPSVLFDLARLQSLTGNQTKAAELLTKCFESTPPSRLEAFKAYAKECKDLRGLTATEKFAEVLKTASKVPESKCSSGKDCGKCPMKGGCSSMGGKGEGCEKDKKGEGDKKCPGGEKKEAGGGKDKG
jgi:tetratricopeptide (TPR) repeat protein